MTVNESPELRPEDRVVLERLQTAMGSEGKKEAIEATNAWSDEKQESVQTHKLKTYWEGYHLLQFVTDIKNSLEPSEKDRLIKHVIKHIHPNGFAALQSFPTSGKTTGIAAHRVRAIFKVAGGFKDHSQCTSDDHKEHCTASDLTQCKYSLLFGMLGYLEYCRDQQLPVAQFAQKHLDQPQNNAHSAKDDQTIYVNGPDLDRSIQNFKNYLNARNSPIEVTSSASTAPSKSTASLAKTLTPRGIWSRAAWASLLLFLIAITGLTLYPNPGGEANYEQAVVAVNKKEYSRAISLLNHALEKNNDLVEAYYLLAEVYTVLADNENAIKYYRAGIEKDSQMQPRAYNNLALLLLAQNQVHDTLVLLDQAEAHTTTTIPTEKWALSGILFKNRAWAHWKMGSNAEALELIERAQKFLGSAQKLNEYPEVFCLHALIAEDSENRNLAAQECINRFKNHRRNQRNTDSSATLKTFTGASYDLYLRVLKQ